MGLNIGWYVINSFVSGIAPAIRYITLDREILQFHVDLVECERDSVGHSTIFYNA